MLGGGGSVLVLCFVSVVGVLSRFVCEAEFWDVVVSSFI